MAEINGYKIHKNYNKVTIWSFNKKTKELEHTITREVINKKRSKLSKYVGFCEILEEYGIKPPDYNPSI